jgi:KDZ transposase-like protein
MTAGTHTTTVSHLAGEAFVTTSIVKYGLIPCAPFSPTAAFTVRCLELYRVSHNRCPHLSIHAFIKSICDLHSVPFKSHISRQFSISYDLYLSMRILANELSQKALGRHSEDWRLRHVCPPCTYMLEGEDKLKFSMLYTMDGNDSLKRIQRREAIPISTNDDGSHEPILGNSSESTDTREVGIGTYLTNKQVDQWSKETLTQLCPAYNEDETDNNPCAERWRNMKTALTAKMWGIFHETGLFLALCRHGFVLMLVDMVRSGEL